MPHPFCLPPSRTTVTPATGCQKDFALAHYGDRFAKAGFATFIFDYRTFGGSEGEPRHWASPARHLDDYVSAVEFIKAELGGVVDVNRVNLWGTSFSGGHVLTLAGSRLRDNITSVVAQVCVGMCACFVGGASLGGVVMSGGCGLFEPPAKGRGGRGVSQGGWCSAATLWAV